MSNRAPKLQEMPSSSGLMISADMITRDFTMQTLNVMNVFFTPQCFVFCVFGQCNIRISGERREAAEDARNLEGPA